MKPKTLGCLLVLVVVALGVSVLFNMAFLTSKFASAEGIGGVRAMKTPKLVETVQKEGTGSDKIAQIDVEGVISSMASGGVFGNSPSMVSSVKQQLEQATDDSKVKAILLRINSPGGEVTASDVIYAAVKRAASKKPVVVHMDAIAAFGGYYIACGATKVVACETTLTGSIGVIIGTLDYSELFDKVGLSPNTFVSGAFKDTLGGSRPMREEEKEYVQNLVSNMYERFLTVVADGRGLDKQTLRTGVADGRVVTGTEALEAKLVDQVGYIEDAIQLAEELGSAKDASLIKYRSKISFFDLVGAAKVKGDNRLKLEIGPSMLPALQPGLPYYITPSFLPSH